MHGSLEALLDRWDVLVLDGGLATELEHRGADLDDPLWSAKVLLEAPELVEAVHLDYYRAGADVATTASYQVSLLSFEAAGQTSEEALDALRRSVQVARRARERFLEEAGNEAEDRPRPLVAGSVGCYGASLADGSEYRGRYGISVDELAAFHRPRIETLLEAGADLLACETIPCLAEALALARVLAEHPSARAWIAFSCRDESRVREGQLLTRCIEALGDLEQLVAVGVNCTAPRHVEPLLRAAGEATDRPLVAYPNSGEAWDADRRRWVEGTGAEDLAELAARWRSAGARLIGGCCRTGPASIRRIARSLGR